MNSNQKRIIPYILGGVVFLCIIAVLFFRPSSAPKTTAERRSDGPEIVEGQNSGAEEVREVKVTPAAPVRAVVELRIHGTVTAREGGAPVEGATVALFRDDPGTFRTPVESTTTGADGRYEFKLLEQDLPREFLAAGASAPGFAAELRRIHRAGQRNFPIEQNFELSPGAAIVGRVVDMEGRPLAQATVGRFLQVGFSGLRSDNPNETFPSATTDGEGNFRLEGLPLNDPQRLIARKDTYLPGLSEPVPAGGDPIEIVLRKGDAGIEGYVFDTDGEAVSGVPVKAIYMRGGARPDWRYSRESPNVNELYTLTDSEGYYKFDAVRSGWQGVLAGVGRPVGRSVGDTILLEPGDYKTINLKFRPALEITGVVVEKGTDNKLPAVRIAAIDPAQLERFGRNVMDGVGAEQVVTDGNGEFTLKVDPTVEMELFGQGEVYYLPPQPFAQPTDKWRTERFRRDQIESGQKIRIEIEQMQAISGIVLAADETTPVSGAEVEFQAGGRAGRGGRGRGPGQPSTSEPVISDLNGHFEIQVTPGAVGIVTAEARGGKGSTPVSAPTEGKAPEVRVILIPTSTISGRISDAEGAPVSGVSVRAFAGGGGRGRGGPPGQGASAESDETGFYLIEDMSPGEYSLLLDVPSQYMRPDPLGVTLEAESPLENIDFTLGGSDHLAGLVIDEEGEPIAGANVALGQGRGGFARAPGGAETDAEGKFTVPITDTRRDVFTLIATHPSYEESSRDGLLLSDSPVTLTMKRSPRIQISVTDSAGQPVGDYEYIVTRGRQQNNWNERGLAQRRVFAQTEPVEETLSAGDYYVHIYALGDDGERDGRYGSQQAELTVENSPLDVLVKLADGIEISGSVLTMDDAPVPSAVVTLMNPEMPRNSRRMETTADEHGAFALTNVPSGTVRLEAEASEGMVPVEPVELVLVAGEQPDPVILRMSSGSTISGVVIDVDGKPLVGAQVGVGSRENQVTTGAEGDYMLAGLEPGNYTVTLRSPTGSTLDYKSVELGIAAEETVDFDFQGMVYLFGKVYRNGSLRDERGTRIVLRPSNSSELGTEIRLNRNSSYEAYLKPAAFDILVVSTGGFVTTDTAVDLTVSSQPPRQETDIRVQLEQVDAVIVVPDGQGNVPGTLTYTHRNGDGQDAVSQFAWSERIFSIPNQPLGMCKAEFRTDSGDLYVADWIEIAPGAEKILTLIPDDVAGGE